MFLCQVVDDECDFSDRDPDMEDSLELSGVWERDVDTDDAATPVSLPPSACLLLPPSLEPSGRETPVSVDSIPLEWDHTVDVGGSSSPEDEDEATYYSALSGTTSRFSTPQTHLMHFCTGQKSEKQFNHIHPFSNNYLGRER